MKTKRRVFFAVLNMGLGHASRSLPIIQHLEDQNWELYIGSSGRSLQFLKYEISNANFFELPDYNLQYTTKGVSLILLLSQLPSLFKKIQIENAYTNQLVRENMIDMIISDHRYGCYHPDIPSFFMSHQMRYIAPKILRPLEFTGIWFNQYFREKYTAVLVPDEQEHNEGLLSGRLSNIGTSPDTHFCGILSSLKKNKAAEDIDVLISISGPEPQRTIFENIAFSQIQDVPGKKVIVLGKPEDNRREVVSDDLVIYHFASRTEMQELVNRSKLIVTRSGYSTLMEIIELQKKALFVPTPGQTEQLYLAERLKKVGCFYFSPQKKLDLSEQIPYALSYDGISYELKTERTLRVIDNILASKLDL
jgi:UDP:flavonoid glycosyltransferase YjiC (YdhE family)